MSGYGDEDFDFDAWQRECQRKAEEAERWRLADGGNADEVWLVTDAG